MDTSILPEPFRDYLEFFESPDPSKTLPPPQRALELVALVEGTTADFWQKYYRHLPFTAERSKDVHLARLLSNRALRNLEGYFFHNVDVTKRIRRTRHLLDVLFSGGLYTESGDSGLKGGNGHV